MIYSIESILQIKKDPLPSILLLTSEFSIVSVKLISNQCILFCAVVHGSRGPPIKTNYNIQLKCHNIKKPIYNYMMFTIKKEIINPVLIF